MDDTVLERSNMLRLNDQRAAELARKIRAEDHSHTTTIARAHDDDDDHQVGPVHALRLILDDLTTRGARHVARFIQEAAPDQFQEKLCLEGGSAPVWDVLLPVTAYMTRPLHRLELRNGEFWVSSLSFLVPRSNVKELELSSCRLLAAPPAPQAHPTQTEEDPTMMSQQPQETHSPEDLVERIRDLGGISQLKLTSMEAPLATALLRLVTNHTTITRLHLTDSVLHDDDTAQSLIVLLGSRAVTRLQKLAWEEDTFSEMTGLLEVVLQGWLNHGEGGGPHELALSAFDITAAANQMWADFFMHDTSLTHFKIVEWPPDAYGAILNAIAYQNTTLTNLNINMREPELIGPSILADLLRHNRTLKEVFLCYDCEDTTIGNAHARAVADGLAHNSNLATLCMGGIAMDWPSLRDILNAVSANASSSLLSLVVSLASNARDDALVQLGACLASLPRIERLSLAFDDASTFSNAALRVLIDSVAQNRCLRCLDLAVGMTELEQNQVDLYMNRNWLLRGAALQAFAPSTATLMPSTVHHPSASSSLLPFVLKRATALRCRHGGRRAHGEYNDYYVDFWNSDDDDDGAGRDAAGNGHNDDAGRDEDKDGIGLSLAYWILSSNISLVLSANLVELGPGKHPSGDSPLG